MSLTTVLADDHDIVRQGLRLLLEGQPDFLVVGEAAGGRETVSQVDALQPDVLVVDLMMPDLNGLEVTRQVQRSAPATRVVILSIYADEAHVLEALRCGALAYVPKGSSASCLFRAIREANAGRRYLSPPRSERTIDAYLSKVHGASPDPHETLTTREREVLQLAARGLTSAEIATALFISPRTVESHRASFMRKLRLRTQGDMIRYALRQGDMIRYALRRGIIPMDS
jgi:DNA-binding NarL/FixJ family response regulator